MCGIVGWAFERGLSKQPGLIEAATERLVSRGPDRGGTWCSNDYSVSLGHRRLSIIDLSSAGNQPMRSYCGRYILSFNGEIYNHLGLRRQIEREGLVAPSGWRGGSDTETLLVAISVWGLSAALKRAVGMFALSLWDEERREVSLARDRFGEKPLYVARIGKGIAWASELKALEPLPGFGQNIDKIGLDNLLKLGYVRAPRTIYKGVCKLLPGSYVTLDESSVVSLDAEGDFLASDRAFYWQLAEVVRAGFDNPFQGSESEAAEQLEQVLGAAVTSQQISDVPLGAFLSGGFDSTAVVALMKANSGGSVKTFTIGFEDRRFDESSHAEEVAAYLGTDHTTIVLSPSEAMQRIERIPQIWDEPFADASQIPTLLVSEVARSGVTVALSGDGGDEQFGGYDRYWRAEAAWNKLRRAPSPIRAFLADMALKPSKERWDRLFRALPKGVAGSLTGDRVHKVAGLLGTRTPTELYTGFLSAWNYPDPLQADGDPPAEEHWSGSFGLPTLLESMMYRDATDYMVDDVLVKVDRAAMAVSLEVRAPFLDPSVTEFAWSLPVSMKVAGGSGKKVLRTLAYKHVPAELLDRPKRGFSVPIGEWLRGPLRDWSEELLDRARLDEGGLNPEPIRRAWEAHVSGTGDFRYFLWNVICYQAWRSARQR